MVKYKKLNTNDFGIFDVANKEYKDGVFTLQLTSWDEFHGVVKIFNNNIDYFWRGQKSDDSLKSSFYRDDNYKKVGLVKIFNKLKQKLTDTGIVNVDKLPSNEIWAIGQHYGLKTPLLDWTESPYIAAYFAFYKRHDGRIKNNGDCKVAIYAVNKIIKRLIQKKKNAKKEVLSKERFIEFHLPNSNFDSRQNRRLINQKGKFTMALEGVDIKSVVEKFWKKRGKQYLNKIILAEILIPGKFHNECLKDLQSMEITHGKLFPDYAGAVDICKIDLGLDEKK